LNQMQQEERVTGSVPWSGKLSGTFLISWFVY
jgi:hypothetical protein